jgi:cytochrome c oxidase subunit III
MPLNFVLDLRQLPDHGFGTRSLTWWGTVGMFAIESMTLALGAAAYLYLMMQVPHWPPNTRAPDLDISTGITALFLLSVIPNIWLKRRAERQDLLAVRIGLVLMSLIGAGVTVVRLYEFSHLNVRWDWNAYGSAVWGLLGLHTVHVATDLGDTLVLAVLMFTGHGKRARRFVDAAENAMYWNFVVFAWLPVYATLYLVPRWI